MAVIKESPQFQHAVTATINLDNSIAQYVAVSPDGGIATTGKTTSGILQGKARIGESMAVLSVGFSKFRAASGLSAGDRLTITTSGWMLKADSGYHIVGRCLANVTSGSVGSGVFQCANPNYADSTEGAA